MQLRASDLRRRSGGLSLALLLSAALLYGCGSSGSTTTAKTSTAATTTTTQTSPAALRRKKIAAYMKHRFGNEPWYPLIGIVRFNENLVEVPTELTNPQTPKRNQREAEAICKAFLSSPLVTAVSVDYDVRAGGNSAGCSE